MPQKHLFKPGKKSRGKIKPPSKHGKISKKKGPLQMKKGRLSKPPKSKALRQEWRENMDTTRAINAFNERGALTKSASQGDKMRVVKQQK